VHHKRAEPWKVTLVDTGENSMTGGRLGRVSDYIKNEESFCLGRKDCTGADIMDAYSALKLAHSLVK